MGMSESGDNIFGPHFSEFLRQLDSLGIWGVIIFKKERDESYLMCPYTYLVVIAELPRHLHENCKFYASDLLPAAHLKLSGQIPHGFMKRKNKINHMYSHTERNKWIVYPINKR